MNMKELNEIHIKVLREASKIFNDNKVGMIDCEIISLMVAVSMFVSNNVSNINNEELVNSRFEALSSYFKTLLEDALENFKKGNFGIVKEKGKDALH